MYSCIAWFPLWLVQHSAVSVEIEVWLIVRPGKHQPNYLIIGEWRFIKAVYEQGIVRTLGRVFCYVCLVSLEQAYSTWVSFGHRVL